METLEMTARLILRVWEGLRLEWLLCPSNLRNKQRRLTKGISDMSNGSCSYFQCFSDKATCVCNIQM